MRDGITTLADWADRNLRVVVVTQALDFNGAIGRTLAALLLGLAEIEWEYRKERQAAGIWISFKASRISTGISFSSGNLSGTGDAGRVLSIQSQGLLGHLQ